MITARMAKTSDPSFMLKLNSIDKVKAFVADVVKFDEDFDLVHDRYVIDAKSIMGIFSLDLTKPITLIVHTENMERFTEIQTALAKYAI